MIRTPIVTRTPFCSQEIDYTQWIVSSLENCGAVLTDSTLYDTISAGNLQYEDLSERIRNVQGSQRYLRLVVDQPVPKEVLWKLSYSDKNILQLNIDINNSNADWIRKSMAIANRCGMYVVLSMGGIMPVYTPLLRVLSLIDQCKGFGKFHVLLSFFRMSSKRCTEAHSINYKGSIIPEEYLYIYNQELSCSSTYIDKFLKGVQIYTKPRNIAVYALDPPATITRRTP